MAHILLNAMNLSSGGGLQIVGGLLSRFSEANRFTVISNRQETLARIDVIAGERGNVAYERLLDSASNLRGFLWQMHSLRSYATREGVDLVFNVNMHLPLGGIPQLVYHMNVLRFDRPRRSPFSPGELADRLRDWRARTALARAERNVFESEYLAGIAGRTTGPARGKRVIYIGLEDTAAGLSGSAKTVEPGRIFCVTSPAPHKDNRVLIAMLSQLVRARPEVPWSLTIAGGREGEASFPELVESARQHEVADRITWLGYVDHSTLARHGSAALCLVSASRVESFCMVALEAMSWGCPAIVTSASAMPESVGDAGILVEPGDAAGFARAVIALYDDPDLRARHVADGFDLARKRTWSEAAKAFEAEFAAMTAAP